MFKFLSFHYPVQSSYKEHLDLEIIREIFSDNNINLVYLPNNIVLYINKKSKYIKVNINQYNTIFNCLSNLNNMKFVTTDNNAYLLSNKYYLIKHSYVNVWYTHIDIDIKFILMELENFKKEGIFTILKPYDMKSFKEFYKSFGYKIYKYAKPSNKYITLQCHHLYNNIFDECWLMDNNFINYDLEDVTIPFVIIDYSILKDRYNKYQLYGTYINAYIESVQNTPLANYINYKKIAIISNNEQLKVKIYIDSINTYMGIINNLIPISNYKYKSFDNRDEAICFRLFLSKYSIRSILYNNYVIYIDKDNLAKDYTYSYDTKTEILKCIPDDMDSITYQPYNELNISNLLEVQIINKNTFTHKTLFSLEKSEDPFTKKILDIYEQSKYGYSHRGYENIYGILGVVDINNFTYKLNIDNGLIVIVDKTPYVTNLQAIYISEGNYVEYTHYLVTYRLGLNNGFITNNKIVLVVHNNEIENVRKLIQLLWNKGYFLNYWALVYTFKNNKLSHFSDLKNIYLNCQYKSLEQIDYWDRLK